MTANAAHYCGDRIFWGEPDDFAGPNVFRTSAASDCLTGSILTVDGGWMGRRSASRELAPFSPIMGRA